jgi:GMP synthase (glutamine-hydrolysing)
MQKVLLVKNIFREGPGLVGKVLREKKLESETIDVSLGEKLPSPKNYSAVFVFGGPSSANDRDAKMAAELAFAKEAVSSGTPYFGVCLGMQALVKANGGEVVKSPVKEIGFRDLQGDAFEIVLSERGMKDPLLSGLPRNIGIFHLHGETVRPTQKMELLAAGKWCESQLVKVGKNAYGIQGHLEVNEELLNAWLKEDADLKTLNGKELMADYAKLKADLEENARKIIGNFLAIAGL